MPPTGDEILKTTSKMPCHRCRLKTGALSSSLRPFSVWKRSGPSELNIIRMVPISHFIVQPRGWAWSSAHWAQSTIESIMVAEPTSSRQASLQSLDGAATQENISKKYKLKEVLGQGSFGVVRRCKSRESGESFAVKTILKSKVPNFDCLKREIKILQQVDHPHIIKLYDVYEDNKSIHLVTEMCTGGELYDRVIEKTQSPEGHFSEYDAARIVRNILDAIAYCHDEKQIVHRDLKPENFLLLNDRDDSPVKIIDFGLSRHNDAGVMQSRVGTVYYVAPEVLTDDYTSKCDVWSIGVIAFVLLCGYPPFFAENEQMTLTLVKKAEVVFPSPSSWDEITDEGKDFVKHLLVEDPDERPTAAEALTHPWLNQAKLQPSGVSRRASFACDERNSFGATSPIRMKSNKISMFQKLLLATKIKKAHKGGSTV